MKIVKLLFIIICLKCCLSISHLNNLQMIVDVITSYKQPTAVIANVCWNDTYKVKLATMFAEQKPISLRYTHENEIFNNFVLSNHLLFLIDAECQSSRYFFNQANATTKMFSKTYRWLVLGQNNIIMKELANLSILVDSEFILSEKQDSGDFILQAVYKIRTEREWIKEYYGKWTIDHGLDISEDRTISNAMRRKDLRGTPLVTCVVATDNRTSLDYNAPLTLTNTLVDAPTKSSYQTITKLYDFINATRKAIFSHTWGYIVNGTWTGMMGEMVNGKADICGCVTYMTKERLPVLEYTTVPTGMTTIKMVFRDPPLSYQFNVFILPFTTAVWYCLAGFFVILVIIMYINMIWDTKKYIDYDQNVIDQTCLIPTWSDITLFVLSAISQQGSSHEPKGNLARIVMFLIFLAYVFFYTSYAANIIVLLQATSDHIRTLPDLTNSKLEIGLEDVNYNKYYFSRAYARDPVRKAFYENKVVPKGAKPKYLSIEDGVKRIQTKPFAFQMNTGTGYRLIGKFFQEHEKCGLQEIDYIQANKPTLCIKRHTPFTEMYKIGFLRIEEHGLSDRNNRLIFSKKPQCSVSSGNFDSVNMTDFYPVLLVLLYGMLLAFVLLGLEIVAYRKLRMRENIN